MMRGKGVKVGALVSVGIGRGVSVGAIVGVLVSVGVLLGVTLGVMLGKGSGVSDGSTVSVNVGVIVTLAIGGAQEINSEHRQQSKMDFTQSFYHENAHSASEVKENALQ